MFYKSKNYLDFVLCWKFHKTVPPELLKSYDLKLVSFPWGFCCVWWKLLSACYIGDGGGPAAACCRLADWWLLDEIHCDLQNFAWLYGIARGHEKIGFHSKLAIVYALVIMYDVVFRAFNGFSLISMTAIFHFVKLLLTTGIILFVLAIREMEQANKKIHVGIICFFPISPWCTGCCISIFIVTYKVLQIAISLWERR